MLVLRLSLALGLVLLLVVGAWSTSHAKTDAHGALCLAPGVSSGPTADHHGADDAGAVTSTPAPSDGGTTTIVEDLRGVHAGDITCVVRYFPLPGHVNSTQAALAAEAAAQQGRFEDMYHRLFETQPQWGEGSAETPEVFRAFAAELGLDMAAYDASIADPATAARVQADKRDGEELGVRSTPSFFVDGVPVTLEAWGDLEAAVERAVNERAGSD